MTTTQKQLCTIYPAGEGQSLWYVQRHANTIGETLTYPFKEMETAFMCAMLMDSQLINTAITGCPWVDQPIKVLMNSLIGQYDVHRRIYPVYEAIYFMLSRNCIDHHLPSWKALDGLLLEFLTQYGPIN